MKTFTLEEANSLLPTVRKKLERIQKLYSTLGEYRESAKLAPSLPNLAAEWRAARRMSERCMRSGS
jgi:hypothetical protein